MTEPAVDAAAPAPSEPDAPPPHSWRREVSVFAVVVVLLEIAAVPVGLLWGHVVPHPQYDVGGHQLNLVIGDAKPLVRADSWFLLITAVAGLAAGGVAFVMTRRAEIGATLGLAAGGLLAGWLAWRVGHAWTGGTAPLTLALKPDGTKARLAANLGAHAVVASWAVAAVGLHGVLHALTWPGKPRQVDKPAVKELPVTSS